MANGDEADYFFIPIKLRMGWVDNENALAAVRYIRQNFPWWDKHGGGGRHIVIHTGVGAGGVRHRCWGRGGGTSSFTQVWRNVGAAHCHWHRCGQGSEAVLENSCNPDPGLEPNGFIGHAVEVLES